MHCRISITAGIQILGYEAFWSRVFDSFSLDFDDNLRLSLRNRDLKKARQNARCQTKAGKISRGRIKNEKFATAKKNFFDELRTGMAYESGVALKAAAKTVKDTPEIRNPKGTRPEDMRCRYHHPNYCNKRGHADARNNDCYAKSLSKKERDDVLSEILKEAVQLEFQKITVGGKYLCICFYFIYEIILLCLT